MLLAPAAPAFADASVRFVNASTGGDRLSLEVSAERGGTATLPAVNFGEATAYLRVPTGGEVRLQASPGGGSSAGALESGGRYTIVASGRRAELETYEDGRPSGGRARIRAINAAPELGDADVRLDGRPVADAIGFTDASDYTSIEPGTYDLEVTRPGGRGGALATRPGLSLSAGSTVSAVVAGTGGVRTRVIVVGETSAVPRGAPATGLGGLAGGDGPPWLLALLAALGAGTLGGAAHRLTTRRG